MSMSLRLPLRHSPFPGDNFDLEAYRRVVSDVMLNHANHEWVVQGLGMLRTTVFGGARLHFWCRALLEPGVSVVHDHAQWAFESHILFGSMRNQRYLEVQDPALGEAYDHATIVCGVGGCMKTPGGIVHLRKLPEEIYKPGDFYRHAADEIHSTVASEGAVSIIFRDRVEGCDTARVFWPAGGAWGDAKPRAAQPFEIATAFAAVRRAMNDDLVEKEKLYQGAENGR